MAIIPCAALRWSVPVVDICLGGLLPGLRQQCSGRYACIFSVPIPASFKCIGTDGLLSQTL